MKKDQAISSFFVLEIELKRKFCNLIGQETGFFQI